MRRNLLSVTRLPLVKCLPRGGIGYSAALHTPSANFSRNRKQTSGDASREAQGRTAVNASTAAAVKSTTLFSQGANTNTTPASEAAQQQQHVGVDESSGANYLRKRSPSTGQASESVEGVARGSPQSQQQQEQEEQQQATEATIGIKLSADDELARAFNRFSSGVGGCTDVEFLQGAQQAYYSVAAVTNVLAEHATPLKGVLKLEGADVLAAAEEARKLIDAELLPEKEWGKSNLAMATSTEGAGGGAAAGDTHMHRAVQKVVNGITSLLPMSTHLAETMFKIWCLQKEKKANLFSIAGPSDFIIDSKLIVFARLDNTKIYIADSAGLDMGFEVSFASDYLKQQQRFVADAADEEMREETVSFTTDGRTSLRSSSSSSSSAPSPVSSVAEGEGGGTSDGRKSPSRTKGRVYVTVEEGRASGTDSSTFATATTAASGEGISKDGLAAAADAVGAEGKEADNAPIDAVSIKVNGNSLPSIPSTAQACALLTMDVVVPPERYASNYEWYYNRIVGYESEYERIAAARLFAQNTPKGVAAFFDFVTRMFTGKPVEFMFNKAIGTMIGLPDNVSQCPPATRKLICMYMDPAKRWILADLIPIKPVLTTKMPTATDTK